MKGNDDWDAAFFLGYPIEFKKLCLVYPPKIKDVVGNPRYHQLAKTLTLSQEEIEDEFVQAGIDLKQLLTPFEYILNNAYNHKEFNEVLKEAFMLFTHEPVTFLFEQKQILIGDIKDVKSVNELRILKEEDYFDFQNLVRAASGQKQIEAPNPNEDPRVKAIKAKARYRDRIKAKKGIGLKMKTILSSICCMGIGLTPLNIGELSYAAISLIQTYQEKEKYELDIQSLLAGADSKKIKPKYWIRNLDD